MSYIYFVSLTKDTCIKLFEDTFHILSCLMHVSFIDYMLPRTTNNDSLYWKDNLLMK